jgi:MFS family permease
MTAIGTGRVSLWTGSLLRTTIGVFALTFVVAFEYLAVATVMPDVARALDGISLYAVAFAAPVAVSVVGYTVAGPSIDRRGPRPAMTAGVLVFSAGLVVCGLAPTMVVFVVGRGIQGFGAGLIGTSLYVVVAQAYPERLRPRAFTVLTGAWVMPALVGPVIAAWIADAAGWRWVFLGVPALAAVSWLLVHDTPSEATGKDGITEARLGWAAAAAVAILAVSLAGQRGFPGWPILLVAAVAVVMVAGPRLLPAGSWRGAPGLPSVIGTRGLVAAAFAGAEAYVPLLLTVHRGLSLTAAGWVLTAGAVTWWAGSWLAVHLRALEDEVFRVRLGIVLLAVGVGAFTSAAADGVPLVVPVLAWAVAGLGIGTAFSTLSVLTLAEAAEGEEGRASSAVQLNDGLVQALVLALGSAVFAGFADDRPVAGATLLVGAGAAIAVLALMASTRLRR